MLRYVIDEEGPPSLLDVKLTSNVELEDKRHFPPRVDLALVESLVLLQDGIDGQVPGVGSPLRSGKVEAPVGCEDRVAGADDDWRTRLPQPRDLKAGNQY